MTAMDGGNAEGLLGTTLAHCAMFTEWPGDSLQWVPAVRRFGRARYDEFLYISNTAVNLSLIFGFVLKNNTHQYIQSFFDIYPRQ
jgi:hypothetical protein